MEKASKAAPALSIQAPARTALGDRAVRDPDSSTAADPLQLGNYAKEIHSNLLQAEVSVDPGYLDNQPHINFKLRAILVDWIVEAHRKFKLDPETLYLAVSLVDRYMERVSIEKKHLQLLGAASLLIAAKYEEIYPPLVRDFIRLTENTYRKRDLLLMESDILRVLDFRITTPSPLRFLQRYAHVTGAPAGAVELASFLNELALVEYKMLKFKPSVVAAGALCTALGVCQQASLWTDQRLDRHALKQCVEEFKLIMKVHHSHPLTAVKAKYPPLPALTEIEVLV